MDNLESIAEQVRKALSAKDEAREKMLPLCRESIRYSGNAIRAVHRQEFDKAEELIKDAGEVLKSAGEAVSTQPEMNNTGMVRDAQKEYTEANIVLALVTKKVLPTPEELGVDAAAYLNGLGEAGSEMRRYMLDEMRNGDLSRGEELLGAMDDIYGLMVTIDYPDAITGGLRRTTDMVRGVLERTRSDLTLAIRQKELESKIEKIMPVISEGEEPAETEKKPYEKPTIELESSEQEIYNALDAWRNRRSSEENVAPYIIVRNSWLKEIIKLKPKSTRDLMEIKGFGERRANKYGKDIIRIVNSGG